MQRGSRWRTGNGEKVTVMRDGWIPSNSGFKVLSQLDSLEPKIIVCDLIDQDLGCWNRNMIETHFSPFGTSSILSIPTSLQNMEDVLIWHFEKSKEYLVRSTYHLCMQEK